MDKKNFSQIDSLTGKEIGVVVKARRICEAAIRVRIKSALKMKRRINGRKVNSV
jgi:hypothetical protein